MFYTFLVLGIILAALSGGIFLVVLIYGFPTFVVPGARGLKRFFHFIRFLRTDPRYRFIRYSIVYLGLTGLMWIFSSLLIGIIDEQLSANPLLSSLFIPLILYIPPLVLFWLFERRRKQRGKT